MRRLRFVYPRGVTGDAPCVCQHGSQSPRAQKLRATRQSMCGLPPDAELFDQPFVAVEVARMQIVKQAPTLADQTQKSTARVMILLVRREMLGQLVDASREQRHLNFR